MKLELYQKQISSKTRLIFVLRFKTTQQSQPHQIISFTELVSDLRVITVYYYRLLRKIQLYQIDTVLFDTMAWN